MLRRCLLLAESLMTSSWKQSPDKPPKTATFRQSLQRNTHSLIGGLNQNIQLQQNVESNTYSFLDTVYILLTPDEASTCRISIVRRWSKYLQSRNPCRHHPSSLRGQRPLGQQSTGRLPVLEQSTISRAPDTYCQVPVWRHALVTSCRLQAVDNAESFRSDTLAKRLSLCEEKWRQLF